MRIGALLTALRGIDDGLVFHWDTLGRLPPELYEGVLPTTQQAYDCTGQFYLGILGLELLNGVKPIKIGYLCDLKKIDTFYTDPEPYFADLDDDNPWMERNPALAYVMLRLLSRDGGSRYESAENAGRELQEVASGKFPSSLKKIVLDDIESLATVEFAKGFYKTLFSEQQSVHLKQRFANLPRQHKEFAKFMQFIVHLDEMDKMRISFIKDHIRIGITRNEIIIFQSVLLRYIENHLRSRLKFSAWKAVIKSATKELLQCLP